MSRHAEAKAEAKEEVNMYAVVLDFVSVSNKCDGTSVWVFGTKDEAEEKFDAVKAEEVGLSKVFGYTVIDDDHHEFTAANMENYMGEHIHIVLKKVKNWR